MKTTARRNYAHAKGSGYSVALSISDHDERVSIAAAGDLDIETAMMLRDGLSAWIADTQAATCRPNLRDLRETSARDLGVCACWIRTSTAHSDTWSDCHGPLHHHDCAM